MAVTEWLASLGGVVGVKLQLPLATVVMPAERPRQSDQSAKAAVAHRWKVPLPKLEFWKSSVATWLAPLVICSNPVVAL